MIVIPAIDLKGGKCVRLLHGKSNKDTVYSDDPVKMARKWKKAGAKRLHVIDLDGAFLGTPRNLEWISRIKKETKLFIQMGGGLRTKETIEKVLELGVDRVILGTIVFTKVRLAKEMFRQFGDRLMVAIDTKGSEIAIRGWTRGSGINIEDGLKIVERYGAKEIIYTDISRDGTLKGVNYKATQKVMKMTKMTIYASGGVTSMGDIDNLVKINSPGCIVGKSLYEGRLDLAKAIRRAS